MVVAQIIDSLDTGGAEVVAVNLANALSKKEGITSHLIVTRHSGPLAQRLLPAVKLLVLHKKSAIDVKALFAMRHYLIQQQVDIVHAHSTSFLYPALLEPFCSFMLVWHDHYGLPIRPDGKRHYPYKLFSSLFDHVFCVSQQLVDNNRKHLRVHPSHVQLLYNFSVKMAVSTAEKQTKPAGKKVVVMSANLRPQKDHLNLIRATAILKQAVPDIVVYCIGSAPDPAYQQQLQTAIHDAGLTDTIFLRGTQSNPFAFYEIADLAVLSSASEGLPLTLIEYGLAGCAVVCTHVGQSAAVVNETTGWLVPPANSQALANAMQAALCEPAVAAQKALQLKHFVHQFFSEDAAVQIVINTYKQILKT